MEAAGLSSEFIERRDEPLPLISAAMSTPQDRFFLSYEAPRLQEIEGPRITPHVLERYRPRAIVTWHRLHPDVYRCAQEMGISVVLDTFWDVSHLRSLQLRELAGLADIITPNLAEALEMTGTHRAEDALDVLSTWSPCVVITAGSDGCLAARGNERFRVPAIPVEARDTTGAGESFLAGLVYGLLQGYPFETCLRCANITGGLSTEALGGPGRRPSVTDIESWLAWYPNTAIH
jgi:sugar/nucleoside kinase (ribokinase family)